MAVDTAPEQDAPAFNPGEHLSAVQGRAYLDVAHRLLWLNKDHERFTIATELLHYAPEYAVVRATVTLTDVETQGVRSATAHGQAIAATLSGPIKARFLEKAETAAVGRALGMLGYGTLQAQEFDDTDGEHLADTPQPRQQAPPRTEKPAAPKNGSTATETCADCGKALEEIGFRDGTTWTVANLAGLGRKKHGRVLCMAHYRQANEARRRAEQAEGQHPF